MLLLITVINALRHITNLHNNIHIYFDNNAHSILKNEIFL